MFDQSKEEVKLEWMYKGAHSTVEREEYLLGRSVDKTLEQLNEEEKQQKAGVAIQQPKNHVEHECIPPSIRDYKQQTGDQVDITAKLQEDPLIAIKKREDENRRQFLNNPIQIKKLQKALKSQKKKNKKKKKKRSHSSSSDSDEDLNTKIAKKLKLLKQDKGPAKKSKEENNLDTILMHKYNQLKTKLSDDDLRDILQGKVDDDDDSDSDSVDSANEEGEDDYKAKFKRDKRRSFSESDNENKKDRSKKGKTSLRSVSHDKSRKDTGHSFNFNRSRSRSPNRYKHEDWTEASRDKRNKRDSKRNTNKDFYTRENKSQGGSKSTSVSYRKPKRNTEMDSSSDSDIGTKKRFAEKHGRSSSSSSTDSDHRAQSKKKNWGLVKADGTKIPLQRKPTKDRVSSTHSEPKLPETKVAEKPKRVFLTEKEKERKRKEMMENASWRDLERTENIKRHREKTLKEDQTHKEFDPEFLQKQLLKSANSSSVESRIKANINNIQRSGNDMNRHFSRR